MTNTDKQQSLLQPFETERLIITPLAPEHQALYISLYTDAKIMRKIAPPLTLEQAQACFELALSHNQRVPAKQLTWAIIDKQTSQAIGIEGLTISEHNEAEFGILLSRMSQGKNIAPIAVETLLSQLGKFSNINNVIGKTSVSNYAIDKLAKKTLFIKSKNSSEIQTVYTRAIKKQI